MFGDFVKNTNADIKHYTEERDVADLRGELTVADYYDKLIHEREASIKRYCKELEAYFQAQTKEEPTPTQPWWRMW